MVNDWELTQQNSEYQVRASDISAVLRAADDAEWDVDEDLNFNEPFDPFADDPE